jgi:cell division initiation protein
VLTPQEITKQVFDKAVFGGYDAAAVDKFLETLTQDYSALYKENTILKNKLKVLVDKIEEYRSTEDAMRMALLSAQKTAKEITESAKADSEKRIAEAEAMAESRKQEIMKELAVEEAALKLAKENTATFIQKLREAINEQIESLEHIYEFAIPAAAVTTSEVPAGSEAGSIITDNEDDIDETAKSIENSITKIMEQAISSVDGEKTETETDNVQSLHASEENAQSSRTKIDFNNLQFGSNYGKK